MVAPSNERVEYEILLKAAQALVDLRNLTAGANNFRQQVLLASAAIKKFSADTGMSIKGTTSLFKELDQNLSNLGKGTAFGGLKQGWSEVSSAATKMGRESESAFQRAVNGVNVLRIALGALVSMLLFQAIQAVTSFFTTAIDQARQFEATLYRIRNAEKQLSMEGVEVSVKELKKGIDDLRNAFPIFSKEDIAELVGGIATTTKELGFTGQEILKLGAAVAILNINSTESETLLQTMGKVANSLVSPAAKSIGNLGLSFGKAKMEAKAFELQILKTGETFDNLTEREKSQIKFEIVLETAGIEGVDDLEKLRDIIKEMGGDFAALDEYLSSNDAKLASNAAAWKDLQTTVGQVILPFLPALTTFFQLINDGFQGGKVIIIEFVTLLGTLGTMMYLVFTGQIKSIDDFNRALDISINTLRKNLTNQFFKEMPKDAPEWFKRGWGDLIKEDAETATEGIDELGESVEDIDPEALSKLEEKLQDIATDAKNAREDLANSLSQKKSDLDTEYDRKAEDAASDLQRKIVDINKDAEREKAKLRDKQREDDLKAEQDYQNKLWELRMRYLMDLEDALHARDARQVIRLQKQFAIDKEALERKKGLDDKQREDDQRNQLEDIEIKRQERLADAQLEYQQKLADQQLAKQRELDDLNTWYAREQADLELNVERRLKAVVDGWISEFGATEAGASAIYALLLKYFGPGGMTDSIYAYMRQSMMSSMVLPASMSGAPAPYWELAANQANASSGGSSASVQQNKVNRFRGKERGMAEGGTLLATRPTTVTFGEAGMEMATFTPMSRAGRNTGRVFGSGGANGGLNGQITLDVMLSPDLEARIVENSMDGVADVILKVTNSK